MKYRPGRFLSRFWAPGSSPYPLLFLLVVTVFVLSPLLSARMVMPFLLHLAFALIMIAGAFSVSSKTSVRLFVVVLVVLSVALRWLSHPIAQKTTTAMDILLSVGMLSIFTLLMIKRFLSDRSIPQYRIAGAVAVYLLLGLIWARLYEVVAMASPGAFRVPEGESLHTADLVYFSFVTLATIGYGDIAPVSLLARNLSILEAVMGQLYLVILISRLVSEGVATSREEPGRGSPRRPKGAK